VLARRYSRVDGCEWDLRIAILVNLDAILARLKVHSREAGSTRGRHGYPRRIAAHCVAHDGRRFDELVGTSEAAKEAIKCIGSIYHVEGQFDGMDARQRLMARNQPTRPL